MEYSAPASPEDFERLCIDAGVGGMEAQNALGIALIFRQGCEADFVEAVRWCRAAALQEHPQAQHHLAYAYFNGFGVKPDLDAAEAWFRRSAEFGYPPAMTASVLGSWMAIRKSSKY